MFMLNVKLEDPYFNLSQTSVCILLVFSISDQNVMKQHSMLLLQCGNDRNAAAFWLKYRNIDVHMDSLALEHMMAK